MSSWIVGVDAGGTNTRAIATDLEGSTLHEGRAEGANWTVHGPDLCRERIERAVRAGMPEGITPGAVYLCIAGYYPPDHAEAAQSWAASIWPDSQFRIAPDYMAAWAGAFGAEPGIVVIAGTGSIAYGQDVLGQEARAGGWGPLYSDEGSAYWIALRALRELSWAVDWDQHVSPLGQRFMTRWPELGSDMRAWLRGIYRSKWGREEVAGLAREVAEMADVDLIAQGVIAAAGERLAALAQPVYSRLGAETLRFALQGGLAASSGMLVSQTRQALEAACPRLAWTESRYSPLQGALILAADLHAGRGERLRFVERLE